VQASESTAVNAQTVEPVPPEAAATTKPLGVLDGIPWPVGIGPPPWPVTQGAAAATKLQASRVPAQGATETRSPIANEQGSSSAALEAAADRQAASRAALQAPGVDASGGQQAPLSVQLQVSVSQARPLPAADVQARDAAQRAADQRQAASAYANEKAAAEANAKVSLRA
jgi:hypothetical protein